MRAPFLLHSTLGQLLLNTVKPNNKEQLNSEQPGNSEQLGNSELFRVTNWLVYLLNSEKPGVSEQFCNDQKVPYCQV